MINIEIYIKNNFWVDSMIYLNDYKDIHENACRVEITRRKFY